MAAKLVFAAAMLALVGLTSANFLATSPKKMLVQRNRRMGKANATAAMAQSMISGIMQTLELFDHTGLAPDQLDTMSMTIEGLVTENDDPATKIAVKSMSSFIVDTMIPNRLKSQALEQKRLDSHLKAVKNCHLDTQVRQDMNVYQDLKTAKEHKEAKAENTVKHGECLNVLEGKDLVTTAYCSGKDAEKICHCHPEMVLHFGSRGENCAIAPEIDPVNKKCCDSYAEHHKHKLDCQNAQLAAEFADKQHTIIMDKVCRKYDECYKVHVKTLEDDEDLIKKSEKLRSFPMLYRIKCLVGKFDQNGKLSKEDAEACKDKKYDVKGIEYPTVPAKDPECANA